MDDKKPMGTALQRRVITRPLNPKQMAFIRQYAKTRNGTQSAIHAGYSAHSAHAMGSRLATDPRVKAELEKMYRREDKRYELQQTQVLDQLSKMVFSDPREFFDAEGKQIPIHQLSDRAAAALQGFETDVIGGNVTRSKYKLVDRGAAVERAMRHLGLFEKDNAQGASPIAIMMAEIHGAGSRIPVKP